VPFGYVAGAQCDPVEKKPFYHLYPGCDALTFGMLGCDFRCSYCQNWVTSQALRDPAASLQIQPVEPQQLVSAALRQGARLMVSSYNEPLITVEWAAAVFRLAKPADLACAFVSNGNLTPEALDYIAPWLDAYKIDLKGFDDRRYRSLGGTLAHVLDGIRMVHARNLWLEIVTLVVPGFNDSEQELRDMAQFIASVSVDIPWHVTAFHPDYRMAQLANTTPAALIRAAEIGREAGLRFVYAGNAPGRVGQWENTTCPGCGATLIERTGFHVRSCRVTAAGACPDCGRAIPGVWLNTPTQTHSNDSGDSRARFPRPVRLT
jgi:pyruvate formate lyase activating enzyme